MRMSSIFVGLIMFTGLFTGGVHFASSLYSGHGVQSTEMTGITNQQDQLTEVTRNASKDTSRFTEGEGVLERAAGLLIVPRFISVFTEPIGIMNGILDSIQNNFGWLLPSWPFDMIRGLFYGSIIFALVALALRYRS